VKIGVCGQLRTSADYASLLAFAGDRRAAATPLPLSAGHAAIDRHVATAGPTAANPPHTAAGKDRRTVKRTA